MGLYLDSCPTCLLVNSVLISLLGNGFLGHEPFFFSRLRRKGLSQALLPVGGAWVSWSVHLSPCPPAPALMEHLVRLSRTGWMRNHCHFYSGHSRKEVVYTTPSSCKRKMVRGHQSSLQCLQSLLLQRGEYWNLSQHSRPPGPYLSLNRLSF